MAGAAVEQRGRVIIVVDAVLAQWSALSDDTGDGVVVSLPLTQVVVAAMMTVVEGSLSLSLTMQVVVVASMTVVGCCCQCWWWGSLSSSMGVVALLVVAIDAGGGVVVVGGSGGCRCCQCGYIRKWPPSIILLYSTLCHFLLLYVTLYAPN